MSPRNGQVVDIRDRQHGDSRTPPHNLEAEESLLGAMLLSKEAIKTGLDRLRSDAFYKPAHGHIFHAIDVLHRQHEPVDPVTVADQLKRDGLLDAVGGPATLVGLQAGTPATSNARRYARIIADHYLFRRMIGAAGEVIELANNLPDDPDEAVGKAEALFKGLEDFQHVDIPDGYSTLDAFLRRADDEGEEFSPWMVDGIIKRDWRIIVIGQGGTGKSMLLHQVAIAAAGGVHPFNGSFLAAPLSVLIIDLENPAERVEQGTRKLRDAALAGAWEEENCHLWRRPEGLDLTRHRSRVELEAAIRDACPDLVVVGPAYKMAPMRAADGNDVVAKVMAYLDVLRTDYGFGLIIEHHPPKGDGPQTAFGSAQWQYWPEISITLDETTVEGMPPGSPRCFELGRARGDRVDNEWPDMVRHSDPRKARGDGPWPWVVVESEDPDAF